MVVRYSPNQAAADRRQRDRLARIGGQNSLALLAAHLPPADRGLVRAVLMEGQSIRSVGRVTGQPTQHLRRRLAGLVRRLSDPRFELVARFLHDLPDEQQPLAVLHLQGGLSQRQLAAELGLSMHEVRIGLLRLNCTLRQLAAARRPAAAT